MSTCISIVVICDSWCSDTSVRPPFHNFLIDNPWYEWWIHYSNKCRVWSRWELYGYTVSYIGTLWVIWVHCLETYIADLGFIFNLNKFFKFFLINYLLRWLYSKLYSVLYPQSSILTSTITPLLHHFPFRLAAAHENFTTNTRSRTRPTTNIFTKRWHFLHN